jgi:hypothetical protein
VLGFEMTGWSGKPRWKTRKTITGRGVDTIAYSVPYSDDSSPEELIRLVEAVKAAKITSTTQFGEKEIAEVHNFLMR